MTFAIFYNVDDMARITAAVDSQRPHSAIARALWGGGLSDWRQHSHLTTEEPSFTLAHSQYHSGSSDPNFSDAYVVLITGGSREDLRGVLVDAGDAAMAADIAGNQDPPMEHTGQSSSFWPEIWSWTDPS